MGFQHFILIALLATAPAQAQFFFLEGSNYVQLRKVKRAVSADIAVTLTTQTPWGLLTETHSGRYWRSRDGLIRQDDDQGHSVIVDIRGKLRVMAQVNRETGTVQVSQFAAPRTLNYTPQFDPARGDLWGLKTKQRGTEVMEDQEVRLRTAQRGGLLLEVWASEKLSMILRIRYTTPQSVFEQRYYNLSFEEPATDVFTVPDYQISGGTPPRPLSCIPDPEQSALGLQLGRRRC